PVTVGVMMSDTYGAAATFIRAMRDWQFAASADQTQYQMATRLTLVFSNISSAQPDALAQMLVAAGSVSTPMGQLPYTTDVYVSGLVPNWRTDPSLLVTEYSAALGSGTPGFISLEGYMSARVFIDGLARDPGTFAPDQLVTDLEGVHDAAGAFGPNEHDYSK